MTNGRERFAVQAQSGRLPDPRGVRVSLVPRGGAGEVEPLIGEPAPSPPTGTVGQTSGILIDGVPTSVHLVPLDDDRARLLQPGEPPVEVVIVPLVAAGRPAPGVTRLEVLVQGWRIEVEIEGAARAALRERARRGHEVAVHRGPTEVHAIIPGVVVGVAVIAGDAVVAGQQLLAVEAMKMQNELRAPRDGTIERVAVGEGTRIEVGDLLLVIS